MTKKSLKFLLTIFIVMVTIFSFSTCFAEDADLVATAEDTETASVDTDETLNSEEATEETVAEDEIYSGDLYIFDTKVVMDKLVDGNVFIIGNDVEITGQVNGNLYVCANKLSFNSCYIRYDVFACANSVYYNGACNDLYVTTNNLEMTYDSYIVRDLKAKVSDIIFKSAIGRDADLSFNTIDLGEGEDIPIVYGNLRYTSLKEITIPEGIIPEGTVTYSNSLLTLLINFLTFIITAIVIYILIKKLAPKFLEKLDDNKNFSIINLLKYLGIGLASIVSVLVLCALLLITRIGIALSIILALIFIAICIISIPAFSISITNLLKSKLKLDSTVMYLLVLILINVIIYGITLIPFAGSILFLIILLISVGMLINIFIPKKKLADEENNVIKNNKKQEKSKLKEAKKKEKKQAKESKKEEK